jgi:hypothetical protein
MDQIEPQWTLDVSLSLNALTALRPVVVQVAALESLLAAREKQRLRDSDRAARRARRKARSDSDDDNDSDANDNEEAADEDEEEEEEDEEEGEGEEGNKVVHILSQELEALYAALLSRVHQLALHPLSMSKVEAVVKRELGTALEALSDCHDRALREAGLAEVATNYLHANGSDASFSGLIPPLPSPFLPVEETAAAVSHGSSSNGSGAEHWDRVLAITSPQAALQAEQAALLGDKKNAAAKNAKNAPAVTTATPVQCDVYHKVLFDTVREEILQCMDRVLDVSVPGIQQEIHQSFHSYSNIHVAEATAKPVVDQEDPETQDPETQDPENVPVSHAEALSRVGTYRAADVEDSVLLFSMDAAHIVSPAPSAFALRDMALHSLSEEICALWQSRPKLLTLLYDGRDPLPQTCDQQADQHRSLLPHMQVMQAAVQKQIDAFIALDQKRLRAQRRIEKQKQKELQKGKGKKKSKKKDKDNEKEEQLPQYRRIEMIFCANFAELYHRLDQLLRYGDTDGNAPDDGQKNDYFARTLPILVLENLQCSDVVPAEPAYADSDSDDDFPALPAAGKDLARQRHRRRFVAARPQRRLRVALSTPSQQQQQQQEVYCDRTAALQELAALPCNHGVRVLWVDGQADSLFRADCAAFALHDLLAAPRLLSHRLRESVLACALLQALPTHCRAIAGNTADKSSDNNGNSNSTSNEKDEEQKVVASTVSSLSQLLSFHVPHSHSTQSSQSVPSSLAIIGGELRIDKYRVIDELLSTVSGSLSLSLSLSLCTSVCRTD